MDNRSPFMTVSNNSQYNTTETTSAKSEFAWIRKVLYGAIACLIIAIILRQLTPTQVELQSIAIENFNKTKSIFDDVTYIGEPVIVPPNLPIGTAEIISIPDETMKNTFISMFSLTADPAPTTQTKVAQSYSNQKYQFYKSPERNYFQLSTKQPATSNVQVNTERAISVAQEIVNRIYPDANLEPIISDILTADTSSGESAVTSSNLATIVQIPFAPFIEDYPVYMGQNVTAPVTVWVDGANDIQKIKADTTYIKVTQGRTYRTLTYTQALANINDEKASIASAIYLDPGTVSYDIISSGKLLSAKIGYRVDALTNDVYPYYQFDGQLTDPNNQKYSASVLTPAIQTNFSN